MDVFWIIMVVAALAAAVNQVLENEERYKREGMTGIIFGDRKGPWT